MASSLSLIVDPKILSQNTLLIPKPERLTQPKSLFFRFTYHCHDVRNGADCGTSSNGKNNCPLWVLHNASKSESCRRWYSLGKGEISFGKFCQIRIPVNTPAITKLMTDSGMNRVQIS
jgi:hypothetical protein